MIPERWHVSDEGAMRDQLTWAPEPERAPLQSRRVSFVALALAIVFAGLFLLVALNVAADQQAFTAGRLQQLNIADQTRVAVLQARVDTLAAPSRIHAIAAAHGMQAATTIHVAPWPGRRSAGKHPVGGVPLTNGAGAFVTNPGRAWSSGHSILGGLPTP